MDVEETQSKKTISKEEIDALIVENIGNIVTQQTGVVNQIMKFISEVAELMKMHFCWMVFLFRIHLQEQDLDFS